MYRDACGDSGFREVQGNLIPTIRAAGVIWGHTGSRVYSPSRLLRAVQPYVGDTLNLSL